MLDVSSVLCDDSLLRPSRKRASRLNPSLKTPVPTVFWAVTRATNLPCTYCDATDKTTRAKDELTLAEGKKLLADLHAFEVPNVFLFGGEPLLRRDTLDLLAYGCGLGLPCALMTNGLQLTDRVADRLAEIGIQQVTIPLEGSAAAHDKLRQHKGAYAGAIAAIDRCRTRGVRVAVQFTLTALNRKDIGAVFDECIDHDANRLVVQHLPRVDDRSLSITPAETRAAITELFARARACYDAGSNMEVLTVGNTSDVGYLLVFLQRHEPERYPAAKAKLEAAGGNKAGCTIACIDPVGNVHYDPNSWEYSVGNVRQTPFSKIWRDARDPRLAILRNRVSHLSDRCQCCRFIGMCNGNSRVRAEDATGNWLGVDPACYLQETERFAALV